MRRIRAPREGRRRVLALLVPLALAACGSESQPERAPIRQERPPEHALEPAPRADRHFRIRHAEINALTGREEVELVFLGDSITQKWSEEGSYVWRSRFLPRRAANFGIDGDRTENVLWRIENGNFDGMSPKLVVLLIGTNNTYFDEPEAIAAGVQAIVASLRARLPLTRVLLLGLFPRGHRPGTVIRAEVAAVNRLLEAGARADESVVYRDVGSVFLLPDGRLPAAHMPDTLHLSPRGYRIWADAIEADVARLLGEDA